MSDGVQIKVKSQLQKVIEDLQKIQKASEGVSSQMKSMSGDIGKEVKTQTKQIENGLERTQSFGRRVSDQLRKDFSSLISIGSFTGGLKLASQFSGTVKESVKLSDTIRKLGSIFGMSQDAFFGFQSMMTRGLSQIGLSSESAANALEGLGETPVRGSENLLAYAKAASQLASISGEKGGEGTISKGIASVITSRGGNVQDRKELDRTTKEMMQIRQTTGKTFSEISQILRELYSKTNDAFKKTLSKGGAVTLASASLRGGPEATAFLESYMAKDKFSRMAAEAQGMGKIISPEGKLNAEEIQKTLNEAKSRGLGDAVAGLKTMGIESNAEAQGFIRLAEAMKTMGKEINSASERIEDINSEFTKTRSLGDSYRANINKVKGIFETPISMGTGLLTEGLNKASESTLGATAVTVGSAALAATLAGGGLRGVAGVWGGEAKAKAIEKATGEKVQKVQVVNWPSEGVGGILNKASGLASSTGILGKLGAAGAALGAGVAAGEMINQLLEAKTQGTTSEGFSGNAIERLIFKLDNLFGGENAKNIIRSQQEVRVKVEAPKKDLMVTKMPSRGGN